ncbi:MAG: FHA domain-containing protein [Thermomicrobiales bacterium]
MTAQNIFTVVVVMLVLVWLAQLFLLGMLARNQGSDPVRVVSGATIFFPVPLPVAQLAPGLVDAVGGFWESLVGSVFGSGRDRGSAPPPMAASGGPAQATATEARLLIDGAEFPLSLPRTRMGRYPNNEVVIDHPTVSAYHAEIIRRPDNRHEIVDRESRNGTRVNGALIRSQILKDGDLITLGGSTLHYLSSPAPAQPAYQSPADDDELYRPGGQTSQVSPPARSNLPPK